MVAQRTGRRDHLHLGARPLQVGHGGLPVGGAARQDGLRAVGGQGVGRGPGDDGLRLAGSQRVVTLPWDRQTQRGQIINHH